MSVPSPTVPASPPSRWGRTRWGSAGVAAPLVAVPLGLVLAVALGLLATSLRITAAQPPLAGAVVGVVALPLAIGVAYWAVVDRRSLATTSQLTEPSVEAAWSDVASRGALTDTIAIAVMAYAGLSNTDLVVDGRTVLLVVALFALCSWGTRYAIARMRG